MTTNKGGRPRIYFTPEERKKSRSIDSLKSYYAKKGISQEEVEAQRHIREKNKEKRENKRIKAETRIKIMKRIKNAIGAIQNMETEELIKIMSKLDEVGLTSSSSSDEHSD